MIFKYFYQQIYEKWGQYFPYHFVQTLDQICLKVVLTIIGVHIRANSNGTHHCLAHGHKHPSQRLKGEKSYFSEKPVCTYGMNVH